MFSRRYMYIRMLVHFLAQGPRHVAKLTEIDKVLGRMEKGQKQTDQARDVIRRYGNVQASDFASAETQAWNYSLVDNHCIYVLKLNSSQCPTTRQPIVLPLNSTPPAICVLSRLLISSVLC